MVLELSWNPGPVLASKNCLLVWESLHTHTHVEIGFRNSKEGDRACAGGQNIYEKSLYLLLNFAMNLILLQRYKVFFKKSNHNKLFGKHEVTKRALICSLIKLTISTFVLGTLPITGDPACIIMQGDRHPSECLCLSCNARNRHY